MKESHLKAHRFDNVPGQEKCRRPGEITVFLSLLFLIILAFIWVLYRSSKTAAIRNRVEIVTDAALKSVFAEYNRELYDEYGLLYVDTTYKGRTAGGIESFKEHFSQYADINTKGINGEYIGIEFVSVEITDAKYASECNYEKEMVKIIENKMREEYYDGFSFDYLIESASVKATYIDAYGKEYVCQKEFSLSNTD